MINSDKCHSAKEQCNFKVQTIWPIFQIEDTQLKQKQLETRHSWQQHKAEETRCYSYEIWIINKYVKTTLNMIFHSNIIKILKKHYLLLFFCLNNDYIYYIKMINLNLKIKKYNTKK